MENKWRAARYGLDGKMIDFGKQTEVPARHLIGEILDFVADVVEELGSQKEIGYIRRILDEGNGADRQLRVFRETRRFQKGRGLHDRGNRKRLFEPAQTAGGEPS